MAGFGGLTEEDTRSLEHAPDYIGAHMGSIDPGPYYLGSGELATAATTTRADLTDFCVPRASSTSRVFASRGLSRHGTDSAIE